MSYRFRVVFSNGARRDYWAAAYPVPSGGFIVVVMDPLGGRMSYFVDSANEIQRAVTQAVVDLNILAGRPVQAVSVEAVEVLNSYETYMSEVREGAAYQLPPLNDVHA